MIYLAPDSLKRKQLTATHFTTLQHTTTHCNSLQLTATHCNTLKHRRLHGGESGT